MNNQELKELCKTVREDILLMTHEAGSGHPGGSLSAAEIMVSLFFADIYRCDPVNPCWPERDRFVLSKGHAAPVLYSVLCRKGFFDEMHLKTLRKLGTILQGHPHRQSVPGLDCSSGSLGQGLSIANGIAIGYQKQNIDARAYCLIGDGELQEGQIWEAAMTAAQQNLYNVCAIVDNNHVQLDGTTEEVCNVEPVADKWRAFNWNVITADGHDIQDMRRAYQEAIAEKTKPSVIIAETIKGKGVSFMEGKAEWHGLAPNEEQLAMAIDEVRRGGM